MKHLILAAALTLSIAGPAQAALCPLGQFYRPSHRVCTGTPWRPRLARHWPMARHHFAMRPRVIVRYVVRVVHVHDAPKPIAEVTRRPEWASALRKLEAMGRK